MSMLRTIVTALAVGFTALAAAQLKAGFKKIGDAMTAEWLKTAGADGKAIVNAYRK